jgi:hypothetical protein
MNIEYESLKIRKSLEVFYQIINESKNTIVQLLKEYGQINIPSIEDEEDDDSHESFLYFDNFGNCLSGLFFGLALDKDSKILVLGRDSDGDFKVLMDYVKAEDAPILLDAALYQVKIKELRKKLQK